MASGTSLQETKDSLGAESVCSDQSALAAELERLSRILNVSECFHVKWLPLAKSDLSGEIKGNLILLYDEDFESARETLKHRLIDFAISKVIEPYIQVTNRLISLLNERAYKEKEKLVERLVKVVS